jgi:hypothetical protein
MRQGTMRQVTHVTGIRRARYIGLDKTRLEHAAAAAAVNLLRLDARWTGKPLDRTRDHSPPAARLQPRRLTRISQQGLHGVPRRDIVTSLTFLDRLILKV